MYTGAARIDAEKASKVDQWFRTDRLAVNQRGGSSDQCQVDKPSWFQSTGGGRVEALGRSIRSVEVGSFASNYKCIASSNKCLTGSNKKLVITSATLVVTSALLVVTRS